MTSAIELYQKAYDLDYRKGDWEYAEELYKIITEKYPYSEEKEYAQIHLDRIAKLKSNPSDYSLQPVRARGAGVGLMVGCFVLILILFVVTGFSLYFSYQQHLRQDSDEMIIQGLISENAGNYEVAQLKYEQAKKMYPRNNLAYRALAELYLKAGNIELAEIQSRQWELFNPYDLNLKEFKDRLETKKAILKGTKQ